MPSRSSKLDGEQVFTSTAAFRIFILITGDDEVGAVVAVDMSTTEVLTAQIADGDGRHIWAPLAEDQSNFAVGCV